MPDNVASMFSVKSVPWHKKGIVIQNAPTSEQAIRLAGMDWTVTKNDTYFAVKDAEGVLHDMEHIPGMYAMVRSDTNKVIGRVGRQFEPLQNKDAFWFFDPFIQEGLAEYETAGVLGNGETVWILAKFGAPVNVNSDDEVRQYLLLANGHDGNTNVLVQPTDVRVVCQNTLMASLGTGQVVRLRHTGQLKQNLNDIRQQIERLQANRAWVHEAYEKMALTQVQETDIASFIESLWPKPEQYMLGKLQETIAYRIWEAKQQAFRSLLESGAGTNKPWLKGTVWWLYNGVTEMIDHYMANRNRIKDKTSYVLRGDGGKLKDLAFKKAVDIVNLVGSQSAIEYEQVGIDLSKWHYA